MRRVTSISDSPDIDPVLVINPEGNSPVLVICEHASNFIPPSFDNLGLSAALLESHIAWDPGALGVATRLSQHLDAKLIVGTISRLIYDCNRPPNSDSAIPTCSENTPIPGNTGLSGTEKDRRIDLIYKPFHDTIISAIKEVSDPAVLVTVHSFTKIFFDKERTVELGVLHDDDRRLADMCLKFAPDHFACNIQRNEPYGPRDGVTHTLKMHGLANGLLNVMIEIQSEMVSTEEQQSQIALNLSKTILQALDSLTNATPPRAIT